MKVQVFKFTGLSPLLMANIESVNRDLPVLKLGTKPNSGDIEKIAEGMTYRDENGHLYLPTQAFQSSLLNGSAGTKFPGSRQSPRTIFQAIVFPSEPRAKLIDSNGEFITDFEIQVDSGVNTVGKKSSRIIVVRPRINEWGCLIPFEIDDEFAPSNFEEFLSALITIWNRSGRMAGVGAWRPEKRGPHGKYRVELA